MISLIAHSIIIDLPIVKDIERLPLNRNFVGTSAELET